MIAGACFVRTGWEGTKKGSSGCFVINTAEKVKGETAGIAGELALHRARQTQEVELLTGRGKQLPTTHVRHPA